MKTAKKADARLVERKAGAKKKDKKADKFPVKLKAKAKEATGENTNADNEAWCRRSERQTSVADHNTPNVRMLGFSKHPRGQKRRSSKRL